MKRTDTLFSALLLSATAAHAANVPPPNPAADDVRENLREIRQIEETLREDAAWSMQQAQPETPAPAATPDAPAPDRSGECLNYRSVTIEGIKLIDDKAFQQKLTECVSQNSLNALSRDIVAAYIKKGYVHTGIDFIEHPENQTLTINVKEGRIRKITGKSRTVNTDTLFPQHKGKPLNVHYLEQGIEQANKLGGNNVSMDIYPHDDGSATVALQNHAGKGVFGSVSLDNRGNKPNVAVARVQLGIDSPLGLSDSVYLGGYSNVRPDGERYSRGGNVFYSVPYGAWTFSGYGGLSKSQSVTRFSSGTKLAYRSKTVTAGVKGEKTVSRGQKHLGAVYAGADYANVASEFGGSRIKMQSPKLATLQVGASHTKMLEKGIWLNDVNVEVGTRALGAKDSPQSPFTARYVRVALQSDLSQNRRAGNWLLRNKHRLTAQYSPQDLYATKQFALSDRSAVRGFKTLSLNGNSGIALNNTLSARRQSANGLYAEPYAGADLGLAKDRESRYTGYGVAAGINIGYKHHWQFSLESARGFLRAKSGSKRREEQISASFRVTF
ncbi:ShlB/FhaC/HecB family hemolysin secretion/activation protein [Conchiformibius kuhniae]|uniref:ShlB/FhaC/HecB family hemolysin secretion/activation protein n=1 Tax=Conchiformibius kuhniae TaxID=211502 RepID=A0A8T9MXX4_9NEIS|nr:ShlB/FhaC/HecB family hemolysin secretion/activation protein [Conchiformibius kuhniae]UOP05276.1 ShlB/FhaC/HecB family hemolysin secretion/activation protein [Conchiformibius kuhniae]